MVTRYLAAFGLVAISLAARAALSEYFGANVPYLQFFPAILVASWYGGFGPGVFATVLSALAALQFFLPPDGLALDSAALMRQPPANRPFSSFTRERASGIS